MNKPVTAQELIDWIDSYKQSCQQLADDLDLHPSTLGIIEANQIVDACRTYLEEMENGTG